MLSRLKWFQVCLFDLHEEFSHKRKTRTMLSSPYLLMSINLVVFPHLLTNLLINQCSFKSLLQSLYLFFNRASIWSSYFHTWKIYCGGSKNLWIWWISPPDGRKKYWINYNEEINSRELNFIHFIFHWEKCPRAFNFCTKPGL